MSLSSAAKNDSQSESWSHFTLFLLLVTPFRFNAEQMDLQCGMPKPTKKNLSVASVRQDHLIPNIWPRGRLWRGVMSNWQHWKSDNDNQWHYKKI